MTGDSHGRAAPAPAPVAAHDTEVVAALLAAVQRADWEAVRERLAPEVVWTLPGTSRISGVWRGREDVVATARVIDSAGLTVQLLHLMVGHDSVVATVHNTATAPVDLDEWLALVVVVREGAVVSIATHVSDVPGLDRFYSALAEPEL